MKEPLWLRVLAALDDRGLLPDGSATLTPAEIADRIEDASARDLVHRFVWSYHYPAEYGRLQGALTDVEAERLVASLESQASGAAEGRPGAPQSCSICGRKLTESP